MSKRGESIWKRNDGRWEGRFIKARSATGKAIYASVYAKTYVEVKRKREQAIATIQHPIEQQKIEQYHHMTINSVVKEFLLEHQFIVKKSTYARYVEIFEAHLKPEIGEQKMAGFSQEKVNEYVAFLLSNGKKTGGGLALKSVKDILGLFKLVVKYAEKKGYITLGSLLIATPKQIKTPIQVLNEKQRERLEAYVRSVDDPCKFGVYLCLYTGLRIGELCALQWNDIDCENSTLYVNHTVLRVKDTNPNAEHKTRVLINSPKTPSSERVIPLAATLNSQLKELRNNEAALGNAYVLTGSSKFIEPRNFYEKYKRYLHACKLDSFNFHALRHTFATRCIEIGIDPKALNEILGHASVRITLDRYVHPSLNVKRSHMERLFA